MCMPVCFDVERPLDLRQWDWTRNFPRRHSHREQKRSADRIFGWTADPSLLQKGRTATIWSGKKVRRNNESHSWCLDADVLQSSRSRSRGVCGRPAATCGDMLRYSMTTTRKVKDLCSPRGAKKKVFLGTSSTVTLLEKNHARNVGQFWNLAGILLDYQRIIQT